MGYDILAKNFIWHNCSLSKQILILQRLNYMRRIIITILVLTCYFGCNKITEADDSTVTACFTYITGGDLLSGYHVLFQNCSEHADSYIWDFGDSTQSVEEEPTHNYTNDGFFIVSLEAFNSTSTDTFIDTILVSWITVEKPNIYIYPQEDIDISLSLEFPQGGEVVQSTPAYNDGWFVHVESSGKIDHKYNYLFYEAAQPDVWQSAIGWCVAKESLAEFFHNNMQSYNFATNEMADFIDYWVPRLANYDFYIIYPQNDKIIKEVIKLNFSMQPENLNRLYYVITGKTEFKVIEAPSITAFPRDGFTVVEWGVIQK